MTTQPPLSVEPVIAAQPDPGGRPAVALTFDDGPNGADTLALLDALREREIRAVFAVVGECILAPGGADVLRTTVADGHVLCNHSTSFADMGAMSPAEVRADLDGNLRIIREAVGDPDVDVPYFRAPNGSWGVTAAVAVDMGMQPLGVVNVIGDWEEQDPQVLTQRLRDAVRPGEIVLAHDGGGSRAGTVQSVVTVIDELRDQGWCFSLPATGV